MPQGGNSNFGNRNGHGNPFPPLNHGHGQTGGGRNDRLVGDDDDNDLSGGAGNDRLFGRGGNDLLNGDAGNDWLIGEDGDDTLNGGRGNDRLFGGAGDDTLRGGAGNDWLLGGAGDDVLIGGAGNDKLSGGVGDDFLNGWTGNDKLNGGAGNDVLVGGAGHDRLVGGHGDDVLRGGTGNDLLIGGDGHDVLVGDGGHDRLFGGEGDDRLRGGDGNDLLRGDGGHDLLRGGDGHDRLFGGAGDDSLVGGHGSDRLFGGPGHDMIWGGAGNDRLYSGDGGGNLMGGAGHDWVFGGRDDDVLTGGAGNDWVLGGNGMDILAGGAGNDRLIGGNGDDTLKGGAGWDIVAGGHGDDLGIYELSKNTGLMDFYGGGLGDDTLRLIFTENEFNLPAVQDDITAFEDFLASGDDGIFQFQSFGLKARNWENLDVVVIPSPPEVTFDITVTSGDAGNDMPTQQATIDEAAGPDNTASFHITLGGDALEGMETASVMVSIDGASTTENGAGEDFTTEVIQSIVDAAGVAGIATSGQTATDVTLTWAAGTPTTLDVDLSAVPDGLADSPEDLILALSGEQVDGGTATLVAGMEQATATIGGDAPLPPAVTFDIAVESGEAGNDMPTQQATILETGMADNAATFHITLGGDPLAGMDTASVTLSIDGASTTENGAGEDFTTEVIQSVVDAAGLAGIGTSGQTATEVTLTWEAGDPATLDVTLAANQDTLADSPEDLILTLGGATADVGSASVVAGMEAATATIAPTPGMAVNGTAGDDPMLTGTDGDDTITGGTGNDILTGGLGNDLFVFNDGDGNDQVTDFVPGAGTDDALDISAFGFASFADVVNAATETMGDTTIALDMDDSVTLLGVMIADLHQDDFML